jgi:hypothetical protein
VTFVAWNETIRMPGINRSSVDDVENQKVGNGTGSATPSPKKAKSGGKKVMARITMLDQKLEEFPIEVSRFSFSP